MPLDEAGYAPFVRQLPHNLDAEMAVLGGIIMDNRIISAVPWLRENHFVLASHRIIFREIIKKIASGHVADLVTMKELFTTNETIGQDGGVDYLIRLADCAATPINAGEYARIIVDHYIRRELITLGEHITNTNYIVNGTTAKQNLESTIANLESLWSVIPDGAETAWKNASSVEPENINWLWKNRFLSGSINIVAGMGDVGKDVFCCSVAACVSTGNAWPDGEPGSRPGRVGIISPEDEAANTIIPRLIAAGANLDNVAIWGAQESPTTDDIEGFKLLIVSPLVNLMDGRKDMNREQDARAFLQLWQSSSRAAACTVLGTAHLNKKSDASVVQRILGASGIVNFVRSAWTIQRDDEDTTMRLFMRLKANLSPDDVGGMKYSIKHVGPWSQSIVCSWAGATDKTPDQVMQSTVKANGQKSAKQWLVEFLTRKGGMAQVSIAIESAEKEGFRRDAIRTAQQRHGKILATRNPRTGEWWWRLSKLDDSDTVDGL